MKKTKKELSNIEFVITGVILENPNLSGYKINKIIEDLGYRQFISIGTTSLYNTLKKLDDFKLILAKTEKKKEGRGPKGILYSLSESGQLLFRAELIKGLSSSREKDVRFEICMAFASLISGSVFVKSLESRIDFLTNEYKKLNDYVLDKKENLPVNLRLIYKHRFSVIKNEILFMKDFTQKYSKK
ncbi:MAG: helix-turn-helix transcriptional regulator [Candidatus Muirbacterium halophilum]|nr:helix-turn-helix transcriptional regulator [Candidatus Muirbacterium halophilum]MCK9475207.1 helix-turn-helix transcriptional regulator [Candidatus Muirbacterium halophilum]